MASARQVATVIGLLLPGVAALIVAAAAGMFTDLWVFILTPYITCAIGYGTNTVAVHMLFHPREPVRHCGMSFQGIFPKRQAKLALEVGKTVNSKLLTHDDILEHMQKDEFQLSLKPVVESVIDTLLEEGVNEVHPLFGLMLSSAPRVKVKLKKDFVAEMMENLPVMTERLSDQMRESVKIDRMVETKIAEMDLADMERMFLDFMEEEFKFIEFLGGFLGFFVGVAQALVFYFS
eukprot:TRINITY_DN14461_c0_g1_i1.p1 TRINITY_DN14461_c0_g1~~TRINITY_DN14461_c0_g1_i1.p1  ORF type:complete len:254 (+),score=86.24 TRINITY_DN14461_c0_g1_i1:63-764(+)